MAAVKNIKKSQREYTCSKCGDAIPQGAPYRYFKPGFRGRMKVRRCMKPECAPRRSELTNNKLAAVYEAQEDAETNIRALKWSDEASWEEQISDIESALEEAASVANDTAQEYEESIEATPMLEDKVGEWRDALTEWAGELESWQPEDEPEPEPDTAEGDASTEERREWLAECAEKFDQAVEGAIEVLGNLSV
jgi:hypothetical protein